MHLKIHFLLGLYLNKTGQFILFETLKYILYFYFCSQKGLVYKITDGNRLGWFSIHPYSGLITTTQELDREVNEHFLLKVSAEDRGVKPKTATTTVSIELLDINDNAPTFSSKEYSVNVSESLPTRKSFFSKALASDSDKGENGTISYHLVTGYGKEKKKML